MINVGSSLQFFSEISLRKRRKFSLFLEVEFEQGKKNQKFTSKISKVHFVHGGSSLYLRKLTSNKKKTWKFTSVDTEVKNHSKKFSSKQDKKKFSSVTAKVHFSHGRSSVHSKKFTPNKIKKSEVHFEHDRSSLYFQKFNMNKRQNNSESSNFNW
jgi:hypothetical protein